MEQPILNSLNKEEHRPSHTAEHLLNQTMVRMFGCERSKNAHIERKKSKINYNLTECPSAEQIAEIERKHVESTKEIGTFKITSTSYNDGSFRIVFKVNIGNL